MADEFLYHPHLAPHSGGTGGVAMGMDGGSGRTMAHHWPVIVGIKSVSISTTLTVCPI